MHLCCALSVSLQPIFRMADAETLLMETSDQNGNEEENGQNENENGAEQELMVGEDSQDNGTDGGKIDASKGEEDAGCACVIPMKTVLVFLFFVVFFFFNDRVLVFAGKCLSVVLAGKRVKRT